MNGIHYSCNMSVSDPLLKDLKGHLLKLIQSCQQQNQDDNAKTTNLPITDESEELVTFCASLEKVLLKGLKPQLSPLGFGRSGDVWTWMSALGDQRKGATFGYEFAVNSVRKDPKVITNVGKMRLLIRTCLSHRCLFKPIELLVRNPCLANRYYHSYNSIMAHEILGEILLSLILQVGQLVFRLDLTNSSFLDETWTVPPRVVFEFVPSKELGICVVFVNGRAVIVGLREYGVAAENDGVAVGDVLEELNGEVVNSHMSLRLSSVMRRSVGRPTTLSVVKPYYPISKKPFPPVLNLKQNAHVDPSELLRLRFTTSSGSGRSGNIDHSSPYLSSSVSVPPKVMQTKGTGYPVMFIGSQSVGERGDFRLIEGAIESLLSSNQQTVKQPVLLECQEMNIRIACQSTGKTMARHTFMEISSCGGSQGRPQYFGYIAGDASCNLAKNFTCFVFHSSDQDRINVILHSIAQGFQRTHFVV